MSFTEKRLCNPTQLTTSGQTLYTVPASKTAIVKQIVVTNVTGSAATFSLFIGSAATPNALFSATSVAANDAIVINLSQVLNSTEILTALASANSTLNITISGVENDGPLNPLSTYIADGAITTAKLSSNSVTQAKMAADLSAVTVTTSSNRSTAVPSPFNGQIVYETDTQNSAVWNGSSWNYIGFTGSSNLAMGGSGHSNIFARNTVNTNRPTTATITSATRLAQGKLYFFSNLTFNMPSNANTDVTDWTAPGTDVYKWSYVYIRPSDNKFYISNTAPSAGQNYKTIGGSTVIYLFPIYSDSNVMFRFYLDNNLYSIMDIGTSAWLGQFVTGINMITASSLTIGSTTTTTTTDATSKFPTTATLLNTTYNYGLNGRYDAGGVVEINHQPQVYDENNNWRVLYPLQQYQYLKTPTDSGAYFPVYAWHFHLNNLSTRRYNFAFMRTTYYYARGHSDNYSSFHWNLHSFTDGSIF